MPTTQLRPTRRRLVNLALLVAVVALFAIPYLIRTHAGGGGAYAGTDSAAVSQVQKVDPTYRPWFRPVFETSSTEVQSGLFAIQAAIGGGAFGFVIGRLSARRTPASSSGASSSAASSSAATSSSAASSSAASSSES
jgi:cobalt/nickel transport protein